MCFSRNSRSRFQNLTGEPAQEIYVAGESDQPVGLKGEIVTRLAKGGHAAVRLSCDREWCGPEVVQSRRAGVTKRLRPVIGCVCVGLISGFVLLIWLCCKKQTVSWVTDASERLRVLSVVPISGIPLSVMSTCRNLTSLHLCFQKSPVMVNRGGASSRGDASLCRASSDMSLNRQMRSRARCIRWRG
jgi:hypothetical protein